MDHRELMSGRQRGFMAAAARAGLWLAQYPYGVGVAVRNRGYDRGRSAVHDCGVPVISIGNITTGGTGKTPLVCGIAKRLRDQGVRVAIVSRGYGRDDDQDHNDEAEELFARLPDVPHVQDADRVEAARIAVEELSAEVILMDDGFQHRRLHRDLNIVVIDATCPFGYRHLLPRGLLREPLSSLRRADLVVLSRCGLVSNADLDDIEVAVRSAVGQANVNLPIVRSDHRPTKLLQHPTATLPITDLAGQRVVALSAIGNPDAFEQSVQSLGAEVVSSIRLPDHDRYSPETVRDVVRKLKTHSASPERIVCTHKDLVKLQTDRLAGIPLTAVLIDAVILGDDSELQDRLALVVDSARNR